MPPYLLFAAVAITSVLAADEFRSVPLSKEDIIELYKVPVKEKPANKFEWSFSTAAYVRLVRAESKDGGASWAVLETFPYGAPLVCAELILKIEDTISTTGSDMLLRISYRFGGEGALGHGCFGGIMSIPVPDFEYSMEASAKDPSRVCTIRTKEKLVCYYLESSRTEFPK